jgi:seryl-tRNA synthetase
MLDINFIRNNFDLVEKSAKEKGYKNIDLNSLLKLDDERKEVLKIVEDLRKERNETAAKMKGGKPSEELIKLGREIKENSQTKKNLSKKSNRD